VTAIRAQIPRSALDHALTAARDVVPGGAAPSLASPRDSAFWGRVGEVWDRVERAIREAFVRGREAANDLIDQAAAAADAALAELGGKAREFQAVILDKIRVFLAALVDQALLLIRSEVTVGDRTLGLTGVDVEHRISLGGNLKASILEACEAAAEGEIAVTGRYGQAV
jgi:hypothetical protein